MVPGTGRIRATAHDVKKKRLYVFLRIFLPHFNFEFINLFSFCPLLYFKTPFL